jgi:hypothetical protein
MTFRLITPVLFLVGIALLPETPAQGRQTDVKDRLVGKWQADAEKTRKFASEHEGAEALPEQFLDEMPKIVFEFTGEGKANITMDDPSGETRKLEGSWEILEEEDANKASLRVTMRVNDQDDAKNISVEFVDDDTLALSADDQPTLVFGRQKEDADDSESGSVRTDKKGLILR